MDLHRCLLKEGFAQGYAIDFCWEVFCNTGRVCLVYFAMTVGKGIVPLLPISFGIFYILGPFGLFGLVCLWHFPML